MGKLIVNKFLGEENFLQNKSTKNVFYAILATFLFHPLPLKSLFFFQLRISRWMVIYFWSPQGGRKGVGSLNFSMIVVGFWGRGIYWPSTCTKRKFLFSITCKFSYIFDHYIASFLQHFCFFYYIFESCKYCVHQQRKS